MENKAPLAGEETDRDEKNSLFDTPNHQQKPVFDDEQEKTRENEEESDDDEILNLHTKLAASSPNKKPLLADDAPIISLVPVPPDGGWGWVIVFASFMANMVVDGIAYAFGIIMPEFKAAFPESDDSSVALVGSMLCGVYLLVGPIVSGLMNIFGGRSVMIVGSIIGTIGFFISYWSPSVVILMLTYGIIGGVGFGFIYLPACVYVSSYFEKKRALATGIAVAGSGFGTFVFAPLTVALMDTFGWRGTLWIFAGMILNCAIFGALLRPLPQPKALSEWIEKKEELHKVASKFSGLEANSDWTLSYYQQDGTGRQRRITLQTQGSQQSHVSGFQSPSLVGAGETDRSRAKSSLSDASDAGLPMSPSVQPPVLEQVEEEPEQEAAVGESPTSEGRKSNGKDRNSDEKSTTTTPSPVIIEGPARKVEAFQKPRERGNSLRSMSPAPSSLGTSGHDVHAAHLHLPNNETPPSTEIRPQLSRTVSRSSKLSVHNYAVSMQRLTSAMASGNAALSARSMQSLAAIDPNEFARPMSRQDIFYPGSVQKLPEFKKSQLNLTKYRESTISIPHAVEMYETMDGHTPTAVISVPVEDGPACCDWIPASIRHTMLSMIDYKLLKSPVMVLLCVSNILGMCGFYVPFVFLTSFAESLGVSKGESSLLLSVIGITNTVGRVVFGYVCDKGWVKALTANNFCLIACGVLTMLVPAFRMYSLLMVYSVVFGFLISAYISLTAIILVDYMGLQNLTNAFGLIILFRGLASMVGSPLAGGVKEATESFDACFYFAGAMIIVGGVVSCAIPFVDGWWRKKYGMDVETNGRPINLAEDRIDELDEIMADLAENSRSPSPGRSASQTFTPA